MKLLDTGHQELAQSGRPRGRAREARREARETGCFYGTIITTGYDYAVILGITLSTIFYTGGSGSGGNGADGLSYSDELQKMVTLNANTAMQTRTRRIEGLTTVLSGPVLQPADRQRQCPGRHDADLRQRRRQASSGPVNEVGRKPGRPPARGSDLRAAGVSRCGRLDARRSQWDAGSRRRRTGRGRRRGDREY